MEKTYAKLTNKSRRKFRFPSLEMSKNRKKSFKNVNGVEDELTSLKINFRDA